MIFLMNKEAIWAFLSRWIIIFADFDGAFKPATYTTKVLKLSFNTTLAKKILLISFICLIVSMALAVI